ncbi:ATP-grasp domain-containing protein [Dactylosporangium sp. CA-092794]|uniref:ATP-grasp domain-containing protein n=1 Tax=Dactylosporangium sp. CA-092794 TaxID=3239929 RepID=UPI003D9485BB
MSVTGAGRPLLLLVGSGDRRYREYILASVSREYRVWLLDAHEPSWHRPYLIGHTTLDSRDPEALVAAALAVPAEAGPPAGVLCYDEWTVHAAAVAASKLGLPGPDPDAVAACRDKAATRAALAAAGVHQPESVPVGGVAQARAAAERLGYPVVVKARAMAGSIGVVRVDDPRALPAAYAAAHAPGGGVLVERYVDAPEISVDAAVVDGTVIPLAVARKTVGQAPFFEEMGHLVDAADPLLHDPALLARLTQVHAAIGYRRGLTHTEFRLTRDGPALIEINARLGGDFIPYLGHLATGVDLAMAAADIAAGRPPRLAPTRRAAAGVRFLYPPGDGTVVGIRVADPLPAGVHAALATAEPGQHLALPPTAYLTRYGYVIAAGSGPRIVSRTLKAAPDVIELDYRLDS